LAAGGVFRRASQKGLPMSTPKSNDGATNRGVNDASTGQKADTSTWPRPLRETYETVHSNQMAKKSGG